MTPLSYTLISFFVSLAVTAVGMPLLLRLCKARGLYDIPNDRKVHHNKIPRLGGVFFAPAMLIGLVVAFIVMSGFVQTMPTFGMPTFFISAGIFLIYLIGLIDDVLGLKATVKFAVQFVSALFLPLCGVCLNNLYGLFGLYEIPLWLGYPLTVFLALLIINSINLIDGIDGLAASLSLLALAIFTWLFLRLEIVSYAMLGAGLCGSLLAFLYYNMLGSVERNTKTFMGDTGSLILGYALAFFAIKYAMDNTPLLPYRHNALLQAVTLLVVPTFDLVRVALGRIAHSVSIFHADKTHIHHKFLATGMSMHQALAAILLLQLAFIGLNVACTTMGLSAGAVLLIDIVAYTLVQLALNVFRNDGAPTGE